MTRTLATIALLTCVLVALVSCPKAPVEMGMDTAWGESPRSQRQASPASGFGGSNTPRRAASQGWDRSWGSPASDDESLSPAPATRIGGGSRVEKPEVIAVLELENVSRRVSVEEEQFIADAVRTAAAESLDKHRFSVLTRESMDVLLPASEIRCLAGQCLAKIGQTIQARFVVGGSVKDVGSSIGVTLQVYESSSGQLLESKQGLARTVADAVGMVQKLARDMLRSLAAPSK